MRPLSALALALLLAGCSRSDRAAPEPEPTQKAPIPTPTASGSSRLGPLVLARGVRFTKPADGDDAAQVIKAERDKAVGEGRDLVVYVGAKWCEPCQRFHAAAQRGELDADFPTLTILEFDVDVDRERLLTAGYVSELIPLFIVPDAQGRATSRRFEGSVKGDKAVSNIAPRLRALLAN